MGEAARPAIFVSHSTKPRELPGDERLQYARSVLHLIEDELTRAGFDTWIDRNRLHPGDGWDANIHAALNTCCGAVILLDPVVLGDSDWVLAEATVLTHRYASSPDFRLIPVLLGGARPEDLQRGHWAPLRLNEIQPVRENLSLVLKDVTGQAHDVAQQVVAAFGGLAPLTTDPLLRRWLNEVADLLRRLAGYRLDGAAEVLRMDPADWQAKGRSAEYLAYALFDGDRDTIPQAVSWLTPLDDDRPDPLGEQLTQKVAPLWVRLEMASGLARGLRCEPPARRMLISASDPDLAKDIIRRAVYCSPDLRLVAFTGEMGESPDGLVNACAQLIRTKLKRFKLWGTEPPHVIAAALAGANPPPCAVIGADGMDEADMAYIADQLGQRFPGVALVFVSPHPETAHTPPSGFSLVEPPLTDSEVGAARMFRCQILEYAGRECPYD
jgi:hypothetical protein